METQDGRASGQQPPRTRGKAFVGEDRRRVFLARLAECGQVAPAARLSGSDRAAFYKERAVNVEFRAQWEEALAVALGLAEDELFRRGTDGWTEDVYYKGVVVGSIRKFSDSDLQFYLEAADPAKYRASYRGTDGGDVDLDMWAADTLPPA